MKVEVTKIDKLKRLLKIIVGGEKFAKAKGEFYAKAAKDIKVTGFRKGAAPVELVEKNHGKALKEEFANHHVSQYYNEALKEVGITPAGMPKIDDVEISDSELKFSAQVEIRPELDVNKDDYIGIEIKEKFPTVEDKDIDKVVENILEGLKKVSDKEVNPTTAANWSGHGSEAGLRDSIRAEIMMEKLRDRRRRIDESIAQHLLKTIVVDVPQAEVENYHQELVHRQIHQLEERGVPREDIEKYRKELEEKTAKRAVDEVKLFYILKAIATKENIKLEEGANMGEIVLGYVLSVAKYS
jgi:FKBP-type peptidyl-prolyl cis-trans isomerase (trigger factor)